MNINIKFFSVLGSWNNAKKYLKIDKFYTGCTTAVACDFIINRLKSKQWGNPVF